MTVLQLCSSVCVVWLLKLSPCFGGELCVKVNDLSHAALPETVVTIVHLSGKYDSSQVMTNTNGLACAKKLREGPYRVDVWKPGFLHASFQPVSVYPEAPSSLVVTLPFSEIREGGISQMALISGTLTDGGGPVDHARICIFVPKTSKPLACVDTNALGEYALSLPPGEYTVEIMQRTRKAKPLALSLPSAGVFRNRIAVSWIN